MKYKIEFSPEVEGHLRLLTRRQQVIVLTAIEQQLTYQPLVETKHRKPMRPNPIAPWELRVGNLRVYYDAKDEEKFVYILAIGIKERDKIRIGKEIVQL